MVESLLVDPNLHELEVLWSGDEPIALRCLTYGSKNTLTISLGRVATAHKGSLVRRFLISDAIYRAMLQDREMVKFEVSSVPVSLIQGISELGFTRWGDEFIRFCFRRHLDRDDALARIANLAPQTLKSYQSLTRLELEHTCSPLSLEMDQDHFLISIRPGFALNLFDRQQSSQDMFGGKPDVLLRWSNVYYRAKTRHKMLKVPGRILWYASGGRREIICVSRLDKVEIDTPKELFRLFKKYGTLEWKDLYTMCKGDMSKELMGLQFSDTVPLKRPVPLDEIRRVFAEDGVGLSLQGPSRIPFDTFNKLLQLAFQEQS